MTHTASVTQKGQVTLPKVFRDLLNIQSYDKVKISVEKDRRIIIESTQDALDLAGTLTPRKNAGLDPVFARTKMERTYERP